MSETYSYVAQLVPHNSNKAMIYLPLFDKNYICVSRHNVHIEPQWTSDHVYVGPIWENIVFPENPPLMLARDYVRFLAQAKQLHGSVKGLFDAAPTEKLKIYVEHRQVVPFFLYFLVQMDLAFDFTDEMLTAVLRKTQERFWIWDNQKVILNLALYKEFKLHIGEIPEEDRILQPNEFMRLPIEYVTLLYVNGRLTKTQMIEKLDSLKTYFISMSVMHSVRHGFEALLNDPRILREYNGQEIEESDDAVALIGEDELLRRLFIDRVSSKDSVWIDQNIVAIKDVFAIIKKYDLDANDPFPGTEEIQVMYQLFYSNDREAALDGLFNSTGYNFHELKFFAEYASKVNTTLINYLSVKQIGI